jgi:hypothetical protein
VSGEFLADPGPRFDGARDDFLIGYIVGNFYETTRLTYVV